MIILFQIYKKRTKNDYKQILDDLQIYFSILMLKTRKNNTSESTFPIKYNWLQFQEALKCCNAQNSNGILLQYMKGKENRRHNVPTDQTYVENINLVTGDKFNYDRPLITEREVKELCVDQKKTPLQKFMQILEDGDKIQKWSIFENMSLYINSSQDAFTILDQISKNYAVLGEFLPIIGEGLDSNLLQNPKFLSKQSFQKLFQLTYRTMTQNPGQVEDWSKVLKKLAECSFQSIKIEKCIDYINSSFSMNSLPQKRRVAFCMIRHLMEYSKQVRKIAHSKILFFNKDQNPKTRLQICCVMNKIVQENSKEDEVWKGIVQYFHDKDSAVRDLAASTLCNIFYAPNFQTLIQSLSDESSQTQIYKYFSVFIITYKSFIENEQRSKSEILSFYNRAIKSKKISNICTLLNNLTIEVISILGQGQIYQDVALNSLPPKSKEIIEFLSSFYYRIQNLQFKEYIKNLIFKSLKQTQYEYFGDTTMLAEMFELAQDDQINAYLNLCNKLLESSKWYQLINILQVFTRMHLCQSLYEKACFFMLKLWMSCPTFMLQRIIEKVLFLVLINKRSFQFLITIRQKILNSKFWNHRKNYIIFYATLKQESSFQCHKFIPTLVYKNIIMDKSSGVRLTLAQCAAKIYKYTDPTLQLQKNMIKQAIAKLEEDKDFYIRQKAIQAHNEISKIDKNSTWLAQLYDRNKQLISRQALLIQVFPEAKKTIKTQNQISKSTAKGKKRITNDQRRTINVGKVEMHKDISIDSIPYGNQKNLTSLPPKRANLFRCHSVKINKGIPKKN